MDAPDRKVGSGFLAGAVVTIIVWIVETFTSVSVPPEVAAALVTIIAFGASYFTTEPRTEPPGSSSSSPSTQTVEPRTLTGTPDQQDQADPLPLSDLPRPDLALPPDQADQ